MVFILHTEKGHETPSLSFSSTLFPPPPPSLSAGRGVVEIPPVPSDRIRKTMRLENFFSKNPHPEPQANSFNISSWSVPDSGCD